MLGSLIFPCNSYSTARLKDVITSDIFTLKTRFIYFCLPNHIDKLRTT